MPGGEMDALALLYFAKISWLYVRTIGVCGYGYIYGYIWIYGYPWIYPWISTENLWIWQAWGEAPLKLKHFLFLNVP